MTITNKQVCEQCGAPSAQIYAYWPATLCQACAADRVANEKAAEAAQESPAVDTADEPSEAVATPEAATAEPIPHPLAAGGRDPFMDAADEMIAERANRLSQDATPANPEQPADSRSTATIGRARRRANKSARRQTMREAAKQWTTEHDDQLPLQLGLCGRLMRQGDVLAARQLAAAAMMGWVNARFTRLRGTPATRPVDAMLAVLRASGDLASDQFCTLVDAWRLLSAPVDPANADALTGQVGTATAQLMRVVLDSPRCQVEPVRKAKKRARSLAGESLRLFHVSPFDAFADLFEDFHREQSKPEAELEIGWQDAEATEEAVTA